MLCQSWISPPANHYTLHTVLQCCPPAVKSPWHVFFKQLSVLFQFFRYLPSTFEIAHKYSISPICIYLSVLPWFPPSLPSTSAEVHPHTTHSSWFLQQLVLLGSDFSAHLSFLLAQFVVSMHYFWGTLNSTKILMNPMTNLSQRKKQPTTLCKWENYRKVKQFFLRQQQ